jgi:hypothetical protein
LHVYKQVAIYVDIISDFNVFTDLAWGVLMLKAFPE